MKLTLNKLIYPLKKYTIFLFYEYLLFKININILNINNIINNIKFSLSLLYDV